MAKLAYGTRGLAMAIPQAYDNYDDDNDDCSFDSDCSLSDPDSDDFINDPLTTALTVITKLEGSLLRYKSQIEKLSIQESFDIPDHNSCVMAVTSAVVGMCVAIKKLDQKSLEMSITSRKKEKTKVTSSRSATHAVAAASTPATPTTMRKSPTTKTIRTGVTRLVRPPGPPASVSHQYSTAMSVNVPARATAMAPAMEKFSQGTSANVIEDIFYARSSSTPGSPPDRYIGRSDRRMVLVRTDGACSSNGSSLAKGACGLFYRPTLPNFSFALEKCGPTGSRFHHTNNRAELRAAIAAVDFRSWKREGFDSVVIATDSRYVINGATEWIKGWRSRGWLTVQGRPVQNRDLWEELSRSVANVRRDNLRVLFWHIPRQWNTTADALARYGLTRASPQTWVSRIPPSS
jgi:ribonuclease HI